MNSIVEDARGRMWFAADNKLILDDRGSWREYPLPEGEKYRYSITKGLCALDDGTILIDVDSDNHHLIFDPERARFRKFSRGRGLSLGLILRRSAGGLLVQSFARWCNAATTVMKSKLSLRNG